MLQSEIEVGGEYITKIGGQKTRVRVTAKTERGSFRDPLKKLIRFRIQRCDNGQSLPKLRTAAALHKPGFTREHLEAIDVLKRAGLSGDALNEAFRVFRFLRAVGCP